MSRRWSARHLIALVVLSTGCGPHVSSEVAVIRLIQDEPDQTFSTERLVAYETVASWRMADPTELPAWTSRQTDLRFEVIAGHLIAQSSTSDPKLVRRVDLDASTIDAFRVEMSRSADESVDEPQLFWAAAGAPFSPERGVRAGRGRSDGEFIFDVSARTTWQGNIARLRLDPTSVAGRRIAVQSVQALRKRIRARALDSIGDHPWKVDLDHDVRDALLTPPGTSIARSLQVPPRSELRFALGVWQEVSMSASDAPLTVRASFEASDGESQTLFEWTHDAGTRGWREHVLDLSSLAGTTGRLRLSTLTTDRLDPLQGIPVWAHPEVVPRGRPTSPNVILMSFDTLRADRLSLYGHGVETSPHIDEWARRTGVTFDTVVAQAPWTLPSHVSILTGLDAIRHGVNHDTPAPLGLTTLAEMLRGAGYATAAITGGVYLDPVYGLGQGFERYAYRADISAFDEATFGHDVERAIAYVRQAQGRPFFLFLHTYEVHAPYRLGPPVGHPRFSGGVALEREITLKPAPILADLVPRQEPHWRNIGGIASTPLEDDELSQLGLYYDSGISSVDRQLEPLLRYLRTSGLERDTIVVLTSDHGEALGEHDYFGHGYLSDDNLLVPLVIAFPDRLPSGQRVTEQVRSIDIVPTILELAQREVMSELDGATLVPLAERKGRGADAWSYAPGYNGGVSLRTAGGGVTSILNNTAAVDRERGRDASLPSKEDSRDGLANRLRMQRRLEERPGLRLRFVNKGPEALTGTLVGSGIGHTTVKSTSTACQCLSWGRDGALRFAIPPETTYTLVLEHIHGETLKVTAGTAPGDPSGGSSTEIAIPDHAATPKHRAFVGGGWVEVSDEADLSVGLTLWWQGELPLREDFGAMPPRLLRDLRTLGYVR